MRSIPPIRAADAEAWEKAIRKMRTGMMPPAGKPRPTRAVLDGVATEIAGRLDGAGAAHVQPGSKSLHRLNRTEYANAIRDLLAYDIDVTSLLPADDATEGFDNIADVLSVSPTLIQSYVSAAMKISRWTVGDRAMPPTLARYAAPSGLSQQSHIEGLPLGTRGGLRFTHNFPLDAEYEFRIAAGSGFRFAGPAGGPEPQARCHAERRTREGCGPAQVPAARESGPADDRHRADRTETLGRRRRSLREDAAASRRLRERRDQWPVQRDGRG